MYPCFTEEGREVEFGHLSPRIFDEKLVTHFSPRNLQWSKDSLVQWLGQMGGVRSEKRMTLSSAAYLIHSKNNGMKFIPK